MSRYRKIGLTLCLALLVCIGGLVWLVTTSQGVNLLGAVASRWVPGLAIQQVDGTLRDLTLRGVDYRSPGIVVRASRIQISLSLRCLLHKQLCVNHLALNQVTVQVDSQKLPAAPVSTQPKHPVSLEAPVAIRLSRLTLDDLRLTVDGNQVTLQSLLTGWHWQNKNMTLLPTTLRGLQVTMSQKATDASVRKPPVAPGEQLQQLFARPLLNLQQLILPVNLTIAPLQAEQLQFNTGGAPVKVRQLQLQLTSDQQQIRLDQLKIISDDGQLQASGQLQAEADWPLTLTFNGKVARGELQGSQLRLQLSGALGDRLKLSGGVSGALNLRLRAETQLTRAGLPFQLDVSSSGLSWPVQGASRYQLTQLHLQAQGKASDYQIRLDSGLQGQSLPDARLNLRANGNAQQLQLEEFTLHTLQGEARLQGVLNWRQAISSELQLNVKHINTSKMFPDFPATLDGHATLHFSAYGGSWQLAVPHLQFHGGIKQNALKLSGKFSANSYQQWDIQNLVLALGENHLAVDGQINAQQLALNASIDAPALDNTLPGLAGRIQGKLKLAGTLNAAQLDADIQAHGVRWQEFALGQMDVNAMLTLGQRVAGNLQIKLGEIRHGDQRISKLTLMADGSEATHQLALRFTGVPLSGQLNLRGHYDDKQQRWRASVSDTQLTLPAGTWKATPEITLDYRLLTQTLTVGRHCWDNPGAQLCVPRGIELARQIRALLEVNHFDLALLKPLMPSGTQVSGDLTVKADIVWDKTTALPKGSLSVQGQGVKLVQDVAETPLNLAFAKLVLNAQLQRNQVRLDWLWRLSDTGQFDGHIVVADPLSRRLLSGEVNIQDFSLALINALLSQKGGKTAGMINGGLRLAGSLQRPQLLGSVQASQVKVVGNFMPFDMQPSGLELVFSGTSSRLQGVVKTSQGQLTLNGDANWQHPENWEARIAVNGDRVRIGVPPVVRLDVSPNVELEASPHLISLRGNLNIPWARIVVHELPENAVSVSSDVVMLDNHLQPIEKRSAMIPINSSLTVHLGDDVHLDAFGLKAKLSGKLQVAQNGQTLGINGQIDIPQGRFRAYGQDLLVRRGELLFSGSPDHVLLNVEAIRNPQSTENSVIAGVRVSGASDEPKVEVFSDPAMSQQEALSYLLRGQGLQSQQSDSAAMTSALIGLGVAQSGHIVGRIGEAFGISNLVLDTESVGNSSQVVLSGYLWPGLQVKYGVGIFDSLATLTLRYRLMPRLYLEAVSGVDQALDLLYQFEF